MKKFNWLTLALILMLVLPLALTMAQAPDEADGLASQPMAKGNWYIVEFEQPALAVYAKSGSDEVSAMTTDGKLNVDASASQAYISQLKEQQAAFGASLAQAIPNARVERGYQIVLNAVAVEVPNGDLETVKQLWAMPGVKRVSPQQIYTADLNYSVPLINAAALWSQAGGRDAAGAGIKIAVIDSGIDPDHAMFDGTGWSYPATGNWPKGYCADHTSFCNGKIISARYYMPTFEVNTGEVLSPQDVEGHGSSMAGIAAGNRLVATYGTSSPEISGVAPGAWIMAYKGLFKNVEGTSASGSNIMLVGAVEDAIADGADVINNSWGSTAIVMTENDPLVQAYEAAVDAGAVVVFSTGNSGPDYNTTGSPSSLKFIEVGASATKRAYCNTLAVTAPTPVTDTLQSFAGNEFKDLDPSALPATTIGPLPYIPCDLTGVPDTTLPGVTPDIAQTEPYASGWIALIPRGVHNFTVKLDNAIAQGADAVVMYTDDRTWKGGFTATGRAIYTVMIANDIGLDARAWWEVYTDTARIQIGYPVAPFEIETEDMIADFSSRGPWLNLDIKPDVVAPGVNILSAHYDGAYSVGSGTSPAAPHVVGTAAMLLQLHPTWTSAQIKSALMTTASQTVLELDETTTADVMTQGSGRIDLSKVNDPGLTFDKPSYSFGMVPQGTGATTLVTAMDVSGAAETYSLTVQETITDTGNVTVTVSPATLDIPAGGTGSFSIAVDVGDGAMVQDLEGNIVLSGSSHEAHIPYWVRVYEDTGAEVLLVDFDESEATTYYGLTTIYGTPFGDYTSYYASALQALGVTYDYWNVFSTPPYSPPRAVLDKYDKVIVYSGDYGGFATDGVYLYFLDALDANNGRNYLAAGGKLLFTGQEALGDFYHRYFGYGPVDALPSYVRGATDAPLADGVFQAMPPQPSVVGLEEFNPFLQYMTLDLSDAGDGAANQLGVDEIEWANYIDLDTAPLFEIVNTVPAVESGYVATRSSYEPNIERMKDPVGLPNEPVSWRVAFLAFGLEGVSNDTGYTTREELMGALLDWMDDEVTVAFDAASYVVDAPFHLASFSATMTSSEGADAVAYLWDFGDGTSTATRENTVTHQYKVPGDYIAYVEVVDEYAHQAVGKAKVRVIGSKTFLPLIAQNHTPGAKLTILHTNDTHAHLESFEVGGVLQGGVARRYTAIQEVKADNDNVILVDAGDPFQGTLYFNVWQGEEEAYFMNALGYQAMAVGNHEFDSGPGTLADFIELADFPVLSANIDASAEPTLAGLIPAYTVLDVAGEQVGVFGLTTEETPLLSSPGPNVVFDDVVESAEATVAELEGLGINKIIALSHCGYGPDKALAAAVDGIDVIVGGHSHTLLGSMGGAEGPYPTVVTSPAGDKVLIVSAYEWGKYLGRIDVTFSTNGEVVSYRGEPIFIDGSFAEDPTIAADVATFAEPLEELKNTVIGQTAVDLEGTRALVRSQETNLGNLICDAMLEETAVEDTQICFMNGGGIRASIPAGDVTMGQVLEVLPFGNQIATFGLTGADVWAALENGVSQYESGAGRFPQVGGLRYVFDPSLAVGSRIVSVDVKNASGVYEPIDLDAVYELVSNDFMRRGGDGYDMFANNAIDPYDFGAVLADAVADYIEENSPVSPAVEGRIVKVDKLITILHTNDIHGVFPSTSYSGNPEGTTYLATLIAAERAKNPDTILLDAGDTFQGNAFAQYFRNRTPNPIAGAMNMLDYDAMTIGNHEYNFGPATFATMLGQLDFPILGSANLDDDGRYGFINDNVEDYINLDVDGLKVTVFGLTNPECYLYELPSNIEGLTFYPATPTAASLVPLIEAAEEPDLLIGLTHLGFDVYKGSYDKDKFLAMQVPGIDVILGGHDHIKIDPAVMVTSTINPTGTLVGNTGAYAQYLGKVNVGFTGNITDGYEIVFREGYLLPVKGVEPDAEMVAYLAPFEAELEAYTSTEIGQTTAPLDALTAYTEETTGANVQTDAAVWALTNNGIAVDFHLSGAMSNKKVASAATPENPVTLTVDDMYTLMPYENSLVVMEMNGPLLKAVLERAYRNYYYYKYVPGWGGYSHYTTCMLDINEGGVITYNDTYPTEPDGNNVVSLVFNGTEVDFADADTYYNVGTVNYLAAGSCNFNDDGVTLWPLDRITADTQYYVRDSVIDYITAMGTISPAVEGRLVFLTD